MESITSFLSPESTERRKAATIDAAFSSLRAAGAGAAVDEFYPKIVAAIRSGNLDEFDALGGRLLDFASKNMDVPAEAKAEQNDMARSIGQLIPYADKQNIVIPQADLAATAKAFRSGDEVAKSAAANNLGKLIGDAIKIQQDEPKPLVRFEDGSTGYVGTQTLSRYNNRGEVIPFGNTNAEKFSELAQVSLVPVEINANPQAYIANQVPDFTSTQLKEQAIAEARDLYDQGNPVEAAQKLNAFGIRGTLGGAVSPNELVDIFGERRIKETTPTPSTPAPVRKPIGDIIK